MLKNIWNNLEFYCINGHRKPIRMVYREGSSQFYACPKYMRLDDAHPDGHTDDEPACSNTLSFTDAEIIVSKLSERVQDSILAGEEADFKGMTFSLPGKHIDVKVLKYEDDYIRLGILNRASIKR